MLIDDPADPQVGYDTADRRQRAMAARSKARLKPASASAGSELFWTSPVAVKSRAMSDARVYFRLFDLKPDGSDFFLYYTGRGAILPLTQETPEASATVRTFIGNGASILYQQGAFGRTLANGGSGGAEARYLETVIVRAAQLMETNRWAIENLPWDLFLAYTPFPDEAEHAWRGHLDPTLPTYRPEIAEQAPAFLEQVYRSSDEHLGLFLSQAA